MSNKAVRQALGDLTLHGPVASVGNTRDRRKTWRLKGTAGLEAAAVLGTVRSERSPTARGASHSGAPHAMAVNETNAAFALGGTAPGQRVAGARDQVPMLMVELDRSTTAPAVIATRIPRHHKLLRTVGRLRHRRAAPIPRPDRRS
ncbi:hypothetical protein SAMN05216371_7500 [Streptomyces sp. TLI_053]|uniref:hypothetical protein n=1 Tax=Streptomyces sp. TLI_053 TaxID=1855352 RepID=UPI00087B6D7F|nr:hypothetical protein [Streptomyces sp. TLI_053]SDT82707.1 hypothetical protein SAMN05216371_7500 [Streptomyces sp. TLI_053]